MKQIYGILYSRLIAYINEEQELSTADKPNIFYLANLAKLQSQYMRELGIEYDVHSSRLKEKLLEDCPYLQAVERKGQSTIITFKEMCVLCLFHN